MIQQDLRGEIIFPDSPEYNKARQIFNRSIQRRPASIIYCEDTKDIVKAAAFAKKGGCGARVRTGGHNYEGFCIGDGATVIDTSRIKYAVVDDEKETLTMGSGITNSELYGALAEYGYPFTGGTCPTVGAVGLTLGGGWGHSARTLGLACDSLIEARIVDAEGRILITNEQRHPELFWALRGGGGGSFGVVTGLKYKLPPKVDKVTYVEILYSDVAEDEAEKFLAVWQQWLKTAGDRFTPNSRIFNSAEEGRGIFLRGFYYGTQQEAEDEVKPFLELKGAKAAYDYVTFFEATQIDASLYPPYELFRFGGRYKRGEFSSDEIEDIVSIIDKRAEGSTYASVALYALGGKVKDLKPRDTAFFYRDADFIIGVETVWEDPAAKLKSLEWLYPRFAYLSSVTRGSYVNFPYLGNIDYMKDYYGENAWYLMNIKERYDPGNLFRFAQSIPPGGYDNYLKL